MKHLTYLFLAAIAITIMSCHAPNSGGSGGTTAPAATIQDDKKQATTIIAQAKSDPAYPDTTLIVLDSSKHFSVNNVRLETASLSAALIQHWESFYVSKRRLPKAFHIEYRTEALMGTRGDIMDEIGQAQDSVRKFLQMKYTDAMDYPVLSQ